jgi:hypothetical protein
MAPSDSPAGKIASEIAAKFLEAGNFTFSGGPLGRTSLKELLPASTTDDEEADAFFDEPGVSDLAVQSVGYEQGSDDPKVHVYVTRGPRRKEVQLPEDADAEVSLVVNRLGRVVVRPEAAAGAGPRGHLFLRKGRIACGSSCGPSGANSAGTLGAIVRRKGGAALFALSNNHVFAACNHTPIGMPIMAPSGIDANPRGQAPREVCRHSAMEELRSGDPAVVPVSREDVAIAQLADGSLVSSWQGAADGFDTPTKVVAPITGMRVKKVGRTTGLTTGTVESILLPFPLPYRAKFFTATVWFQDVWTVLADPGYPFALSGDSGSLVVDETGKAAVGLVFAAGSAGDYGLMIPMTHVVSLLGGLTLVGNHNV